MADNNQKKAGSNKKIIIGVAAVIVLVVVFAVIYNVFSPGTEEGSKAYTLEVVDDTGESTVYEGTTDAEYLSELMDELAAAEDFSYDGYDSDYGLYITTVNGLLADYDTDGAYWSIYVNGEYGMYGADSQVVTDGDAFSFVYEVYVWE